MKQELTKEQEIGQAIQELHIAFIENIKAEQKIIEVNREKTKTHYNLLKAKERLNGLEMSLYN